MPVRRAWSAWAAESEKGPASLDFEPGIDRIGLGAIDASTAIGGDRTFVLTGAHDDSVSAGEVHTSTFDGWTLVHLSVTDGDPAESAFAIQGAFDPDSGDFHSDRQHVGRLPHAAGHEDRRRVTAITVGPP